MSGDQLALEEAQTSVQERSLPPEQPRLGREGEGCSGLPVEPMRLEAPVGDLRAPLACELQQRSYGVGAQVIVIVEVQKPSSLRETSSLVAGHRAPHHLVTRRIGMSG